MSKHQPPGVGMTPGNTELGIFIRTRRLKLRLSQKTLAEKTGCSQALISDLEIGIRNNLKDRNLDKFSEVLRCNPEELQIRMPEKHTPEPRTKLGRLMRARRKEIGMTLEDLVREMETSLQQVKSLELRPKPLLRFNTARKLAGVLGLELSTFAEFVGINTKPTNSALGLLVRTRRQELGMSSTRLAAELGVSRQFVSQVECGQLPLLNKSKKMIQQLAEILEIEVEQLKAARPRRRLVQRKRPTPLASFLTERRLRLGLNQTQVGTLAKLGSSTISRIETGDYHPGRRTLGRLSKALECEIPPGLL